MYVNDLKVQFMKKYSERILYAMPYQLLAMKIPKRVTIEPTNYCNLACPLCPTGAGEITRKKGMLKFEDFKKVIDDVGKYLIHIRLWNWGEPLINKDLPKMIAYAKKHKIYVNTSTNASFLTENIARELVRAKLDLIILSIDGASEESYSLYRKNGNFKQCINSIKALVNEKKRFNSKYPRLVMQFIVMKHNEHEIEKITNLAKELGVDELILKTVAMMTPGHEKLWREKYLPKAQTYHGYESDVNKKLINRDFCDVVYEECVINWNGDITTCCYDHNGKFTMGNVFKQSLSDLWNNKKYMAFRQAIMRNKKAIAMCKDCPGSNKTLKLDEITIFDSENQFA